MKASKKQKVLPAYMEFNTWIMLDGFLEREEKSFHEAYCKGASLAYDTSYEVGSGYPPKQNNLSKESRVALNKMWEGYRQWVRYVQDMRNQLKYAFSKGAHPNVIKHGFFKQSTKK